MKAIESKKIWRLTAWLHSHEVSPAAARKSVLLSIKLTCRYTRVLTCGWVDLFAKANENQCKITRSIYLKACMLGLWYRLKIGFSIGEHLFRKGIKVHAQPVRCTHEQPGHIVLCVCMSQNESVQCNKRLGISFKICGGWGWTIWLFTSLMITCLTGLIQRKLKKSI